MDALTMNGIQKQLLIYWTARINRSDEFIIRRIFTMQFAAVDPRRKFATDFLDKGKYFQYDLTFI